MMTPTPMVASLPSKECFSGLLEYFLSLLFFSTLNMIILAILFFLASHVAYGGFSDLLLYIIKTLLFLPILLYHVEFSNVIIEKKLNLS